MQNQTLNAENFLELKSQIIEERATLVKKVKDDIARKESEEKKELEEKENSELKIFFSEFESFRKDPMTVHQNYMKISKKIADILSKRNLAIINGTKVPPQFQEKNITSDPWIIEKWPPAFSLESEYRLFFV